MRHEAEGRKEQEDEGDVGEGRIDQDRTLNGVAGTVPTFVSSTVSVFLAPILGTALDMHSYAIGRVGIRVGAGAVVLGVGSRFLLV